MTSKRLLLQPLFLVTLSLAGACGGELVSSGDGGSTASSSNTTASGSTSSSTGTVSTGSSTSTGSASSSNGSSTSSTGGGDMTAPNVVFTTPADTEMNVPLNANVTATFNEEMAPGTIGAGTFLLFDGAVPVGGAVSYLGTVATLDPTAPLKPNTSYVATITTGATDLAGNPLVALETWTFQTGASAALGPAVVNLGTSGGFVILAKSGITTIPTSAVTGDIGVSPIDATAITGFSLMLDPSGTFSKSTQVIGNVFAASYTSPTPSNLTVAIGNMQAAYTDAAGRPTPDFVDLGGGQLGGLTLAPGLYKWGTNVLISTDVTLDGGPDDVWIFQISGGITEASGAQVLMSGGARPRNVFWQAAGAVALGTGAHLEGIVLAETQITLATGATANGRLLSQTAVTLDKATVTQPAP